MNVMEEIFYKAIDEDGNSAIARIKINVQGCDIEGCDGIPGSGIKFDDCGVCGGNNECVDCNGVINGDAVEDICGICGGNGNTCPDVLILMEYNERIANVGLIEVQENQVATISSIPAIVWVTIGILPIILGALVLLVYFYQRNQNKKRRTVYPKNVSYNPTSNSLVQNFDKFI